MQTAQPGVSADPPQPEEKRFSQRTWPWAVGSILAVLLVVVGALAGRHLVSGSQHAAAVVAAPSAPALAVVGLTPPTTSIQRAALDASAGHVVALASSAGASTPQCPPVSACPAAPAQDTLLVLDGGNGNVLARTPLVGAAAPAAQSVALLTDASAHRAYAISSQAIVVFSTETGAPDASYSVAAATQGQAVTGAALDPARHALLVVAGNQLIALDAGSGHVLASQTLMDAAQGIDGPVFDTKGNRIYVLAPQAAQHVAMLYAYNAQTLALIGQTSLPAFTRLGPFNPVTRTLYTFAAGGFTYAIPVDTVFPEQSSPAGITLGGILALKNARALGWDAALGQMYVATPSGLRAQDAASGHVVAALPLRVAWGGAEPLLTDTARGLLYLPTPQGSLAIVRVPQGAAALTTGTAVVLARSALATFLPNTNQDPPFVAPEMFPLSGTSPVNYWVHFSDLGWRGPYPGSAATAVQSEAGHPGAYLVTFTITWNQLFLRSHTWVCEVAADGSVRLRSDTGDAVP